MKRKTKKQLRKLMERIMVCFLSFLMVFTMLDFTAFEVCAEEGGEPPLIDMTELSENNECEENEAGEEKLDSDKDPSEEDKSSDDGNPSDEDKSSKGGNPSEDGNPEGEESKEDKDIEEGDILDEDESPSEEEDYDEDHKDTLDSAQEDEYGIFQDVKVEYSEYTADIAGTFIPAENCTLDKITLYQVDEDGKEIKDRSVKVTEEEGKVLFSSDVTLKEAAAGLKLIARVVWKPDPNVSGIYKEVQSEIYLRKNHPGVIFYIDHVRIGATVASFDLNYSGSADKNYTINYKFFYGTSEDRDTWKSFYGTESIGKRYNRINIKVKPFEPDTVYYGEIQVGISVDGNLDYGKVYELGTFTTKKNETYQVDEIFPDEAFRNIVLAAISPNEPLTEVKTSDLEKVKYIIAHRKDFDTPAVQNIDGIEYLTELESLELNNHDISDITGYDWPGLPLLRNLYLSGNDLRKIPDLTKNDNLNIVYFKNNLLPKSETDDFFNRVPKSVKGDNGIKEQRTDGIFFLKSDIYYQNSGKNPFIIMRDTKELPYDFVCTIDGTEVALKKYDKYNYVFLANTDTGLSLGTHTAKIEMYAGEELLETEEFTFEMVEENRAVGGDDPYQFSVNDTYIYLNIYSSKPVKEISLKQGDTEYASNQEVKSRLEKADDRYRCFKDSVYFLDSYFTAVPLYPYSSQYFEKGIYDVYVTYEDGTVEVIEGLVVIGDLVPKVSTLQQIGNYPGYDHSRNYFYSLLVCEGADPYKLSYDFTCDGKALDVKMIDAKKHPGGYIIKFRKGADWPEQENKIKIKIQGKNGYNVNILNDSLTYEAQKRYIFYSHLNKNSNEIILGTSSDIDDNDLSFKLTAYYSLSDYNNKENGKELGVKRERKDSFLHLKLLSDKDGELLETLAGIYFINLEVKDNHSGEVMLEKNISVGFSGDPFWYEEGREDKIGALEPHLYSYITYVPFSEEEIQNFDVKLTDKDGQVIEGVLENKVVGRKASETSTFIGIDSIVDVTKLKGNESYTLEAYYKGEKSAAKTFFVAGADTFLLLSDPYAYWAGSKFTILFPSLNTVPGDEFMVELADKDGKKLKGIQTRLKDEFTIELDGIKKEGAEKSYYIKISKVIQGKVCEAKRYDESTGGAAPFYTDELGIKTEIQGKRISSSGLYPETSYYGSSICRINIVGEATFPVTVDIYRTYDTDKVLSLTLQEEDFERVSTQVVWYFFNRDFINRLPDPGLSYDMYISDSKGIRGTYMNCTFMNDEKNAWEWSLSDTRFDLDINSEDNRKGTLTVKGNIGTPIFESSNPEVAVVEVSAEDKNKAVITAVSEGMAVIKVTIDGKVRTATVYVTDLKDIPEDEKEEIIREEIGKIYFIKTAETVDDTLGSIPLPAGWSWVYPEDRIVADDALPIQRFAAKYEKEGYAPAYIRLPVYVTEIKEVRISGPSTALVGDEATMRAWVDYKGYNPKAWTMEWNWTTGKDGSEGNVGEGIELVSGTESKKVTAKINGTDTLNVKLTLTNPGRGNKGSMALEGSKEITVRDLMLAPAETQPDKAVPYVINGPKSVITIDAKDFDKKSACKLALEITGQAEGNRKWSSTDTGVLTVDKNGIVTIKKAGIAIVKLAVGEKTAKILIRVEDYAPILENKAITVNQNDSFGVWIGLTEQNGNAITGITITGVSTPDANKIEASSTDGKWILKASGYKKKTVENLKLSVYTEKEKDPYKYDVKVTVDVAMPDKKSVTFRQTFIPNAFYCGDEAESAEFLVSSTKYDITGISGKAVKGTYNVESYDPFTGKLVMKPNGYEKNSPDPFLNTSKINVEVAGYGTVEMDLTVKTAYKKPVLKITDVNLIKGKAGEATADLLLNKQPIQTQGITFGNFSAEGASVKAENGRLHIQYSGTKSVTNRMTASRESWASDLAVSSKINVVDSGKLALAADMSKVTMNAGANWQDPVMIKAYVKGNETLPVELSAGVEKNKLLIRDLGKDGFEISLPENVKTGTYKIKIDGKVDGESIKPVTVKVVVVNKEPVVKVTAKGSINLAKRAESVITYTPKISNLPENLKIRRVSLDEESSKLFGAKLKDGKVMVSAYPGAYIKANRKYEGKMKFTLTNGKVLEVPVTIKPVDKLLKVKAAAKNKVLYKANLKNEAVYKLNVDQGYAITRLVVEPDKAGNYKHFRVKLNDDNTVSIKLKDKTLKGGNYTITCKALVEEAGNVKPVKISLKVKVQ